MTIPRHERQLAVLEQARLRSLIRKENPRAADLPVADLVVAGLAVVGAIALLEAMAESR